jgi:hypothetical protein
LLALLVVASRTEAALAADPSIVPQTKIAAARVNVVFADISVLRLSFIHLTTMAPATSSSRSSFRANMA